MNPHKEAIDVLEKHARALDQLGVPRPNTVTQEAADINKAKVEDIRKTLAALTDAAMPLDLKTHLFALAHELEDGLDGSAEWTKAQLASFSVASALRRWAHGIDRIGDPGNCDFQPLPPGSPGASEMIDRVLSEYGWPANTKNAARAGYVAALRLMRPNVRAKQEPTA